MRLDETRQQLAGDADYVAAEEELGPLLDLADAVLAQRLARGWSQAELAERAGTRQANISRLESGLSNPSVRFLQKLAEALGARLVIRLEPRRVPGSGSVPGTAVPLSGPADDAAPLTAAPGHAHVVRIPGVHGGRPVVRGTGVSVQAIVEQSLLGRSPQQVAEDYAGVLTLAQVHAALSYFYDHQDEIEGAIAENCAALRAASPQG